MHSLKEEADEAAGSGSIPDSNGDNHDLLAIAGSASDLYFTESVGSSDNENDEAVFHGNDDDAVQQSREVLEPTPAAVAAPHKEEKEEDISTKTLDLIKRSQKECERQRQKLENRRSSVTRKDLDVPFEDVSAAVPDESDTQSESLNVPLATKRGATQRFGQQDGLSNLQEPPISPLVGANSASLAMPTNAYSDCVEESGVADDPLEQTSSSDICPAPFALPSSYHVNDENDRRRTFNPQMSLDLRTIFISRRSVLTGYHDSLSALSTFSHNVMVSVFAPDDEACCRGRQGYIIFVIMIVASVILFAEFLDTDGGSKSGLEIVVSQSPTEPPSYMPSIVPTLSPSLFPSAEPTLASTLLPTVMPSPIHSRMPSIFEAAPTSLSPSDLLSSLVVPSSSATAPEVHIASIAPILAPSKVFRIPLTTMPQPLLGMAPQERWPQQQRQHHSGSHSHLR